METLLKGRGRRCRTASPEKSPERMSAFASGSRRDRVIRLQTKLSDMSNPEEPSPSGRPIADQVRDIAARDVSAARSLIQAREIDHPSDPGLLTARAYLHAALGEENEAEALFFQRLSLGTDPGALIGLARSLMARGRIADMTELLARHEGIDAPDVHMSRFFVSASIEGRSSGSEAALARCPEKDRQNALAVTGISALQRRDVARARELCDWGVDIPGAAPDIHNLAAELARRDRDFARAADEIERFRRLGGSEPSAAYMEGSLLLAQGRRAEALDRYDAAVALRPGWRLALQQAGRLAVRLRRWADVGRYAGAQDASDPIEAATLRLFAALGRGRPREAFRLLRGLGKKP